MLTSSLEYANEADDALDPDAAKAEDPRVKAWSMQDCGMEAHPANPSPFVGLYDEIPQFDTPSQTAEHEKHNKDIDDAKKSTELDLFGMIPGVNEISTLYDSGKLAVDTVEGDDKAAHNDEVDLGLDLVGLIPGVGTMMGLEQMAFDGNATEKRIHGDDPDHAPTFHEAVYHKFFGYDDDQA